ncbi:hypothetical protein [Methanosarcina mazei]|uniref:hypothetical protein n=1 Tax=Methanosarcina mazei TaxID=2209 RepID=UPI00128B0310|nr:hypothetical protein [Methanosarcina mazei]BBL64764.1 hypothetical protein MmazTMA_17410 [Methanosarcina mazei]
MPYELRIGKCSDRSVRIVLTIVKGKEQGRLQTHLKGNIRTFLATFGAEEGKYINEQEKSLKLI